MNLNIGPFWRQYRTWKKKRRYEWLWAQLALSLAMQVREMRLQRGWSQAELAQRAGIEQATVSRLESAKALNVTVNTLIRIAGAFDVAFIGRFVSHGQAVTYLITTMGGEILLPETFEQEDAHAAEIFAALDEHSDERAQADDAVGQTPENPT